MRSFAAQPFSRGGNAVGKFHVLAREFVFEPLDLIAERSRGLVIFFLHCLLEILVQRSHAIAQFDLAVRALRKLADMFGALVHGLEQRPQCFAKSNVTSAAAETACLLEISLRETTDRTFLGWPTLLYFLSRSNA